MLSTKIYGSRYVRELKVLFLAYALSSVAILPMVVQIFGIYSPFVYGYIWIFGAANIILFALLTAIFTKIAYKIVVYLAAVSANAYLLFDQLSFDPNIYSPDAINTNLMIFTSVVTVFGILSVIFEGRLPNKAVSPVQ